MKGVRIDATSVAIGGLAGLCAGGLLGYLLGRHHVRAWAQACIEDETRAIRDYYKDRTAAAPVGDPADGDAGVPDDPSDEPGEEDEEDILEGDYEDEDEEDGDFWPPRDRDRSKPYVISVVEFADHEVGDGWTQVAATWYAADGALVDESERVIRDVKNTTGPLSVSKFREENHAGAPNKIFIRNERLKIDFEVDLDHRSYTEGVLGYGNPRLPDG